MRFQAVDFSLKPFAMINFERFRIFSMSKYFPGLCNVMSINDET